MSATLSNNPKGIISSRAMVFAALLLAFCSSSLGAPRKLRVSDPVEERAMIQDGARVIADYGSFRLIETDDSRPRGQRFEREDDSDVIELNARRLDTRRADVRALRKQRVPFAGRRLHLIQFAGPVKPEWREALESFGVKFLNYVPQNAFLVQGNSQALARAQAWAASNNVVQWDAEYSGELKIDRDAATSDEDGNPRTPVTDKFTIQILDDAEANPETLALIRRLMLSPVEREFTTLNFRNIIVRLPAGELAKVAERPDVISIQPAVAPEKRDERQSQIIAGNISGSGPSAPGYLAWLASKGFTQAQFDASGFVVDISDSGVDNGTTTPGNFGLYSGGDPFATSRIVYNRVEGSAHAGSTTAGCDGHGTLNAHIIMGFSDAAAGFPHTDASGYRYGLGICPFAKLGSSVIFDPDVFTSPNYPNLQSKAYNDGARVSANSWGGTNNTYTADSQAFDALVRDAQPAGSTFAVAGNQQMVIVFAAGNKGSAANTVGWPGNAKNVITVGASESVRSLSIANGGAAVNGGDGCGFTDTSADNFNDIATFSSRGPCHDGRQKPDLVAPGTHIVGGVGQSSTNTAGNGSALACFKASGICALPGKGGTSNPDNFFPLGQEFYTVSSGTSHATPAVAGACALIRQYFINSNLPPPSPAMTKAYLMNSTRYLTGVSANDTLWSPNQGMGELNLGAAFDGTPRILRDQAAADKFTATGQTRVFTVSISDTNKPFRATLAWTDAPGSTTGNAYNNNLDLTAAIGSATYKGNVFSGQYSVAGGSADVRNNVENIFLPAGVSGTVVITVNAANINSDGVPNEAPSMDQDFALVLYNASSLAVSGYSVIEESCFATNAAVDAGETVTVNFTLMNSGDNGLTNVTATLLPGNGVMLPSVPQDFGTLAAAGGNATRAFTFTVAGTCGGSVQAALEVQAGGTNVGIITQNIPIGNVVVLTHNFTNATSLTIPGSGAASVYPSTITVSGVTGTVVKVTATLRGLTHFFPDDLDVLLARDGGTNVMLMSDCGGSPDFVAGTLTFDDSASALPDSSLITSGTWKPTNFDTGTDAMQSPAPSAPYGTALFAFTNGSPNGDWRLFIRDDNSMSSGSMTQGWVLSITTSNIYCCNTASNSANLGVSALLPGPVVNIGSNVTLLLTVTNHGADPAAFVRLTNTISPQLGFLSAAPSQGVCSNSGGVLRCEIGSLAAGSSASVTINAVALSGGLAGGYAEVGSAVSDSVSSNNTVSASLFVNTPPVVVAPGNISINENTNTGPLSFYVDDAETNAMDLQVSISCSDTNLIPLANIVPGGSGTNRTVQLIPATNTTGVATITVSVNDGHAVAADDFTVTVAPVNDAPTLAAIANRTIHAGSLLMFTNNATDVDLPADVLTFSLDAGAPVGAAIGAADGVLTWQSGDADANTTNQFTVRVTDNGAPALADTKTFNVVVVERPVISLLEITNQTVWVTWSAVAGQSYLLECSTNLTTTNWTGIVPQVISSGDHAVQTNLFDPQMPQFFRVRVLP